MRKKAILIRLLLGIISVLVFNIHALHASYDPQIAVDYANTWWNGRNTDQYQDYGELDCANFVSQCLIAGGMDLSSGITDAHGCIVSCTNLNQYLVEIGAKHVTWCKGHMPTEPEWFLPGDVAIFGYTDGNGAVHPYAHAVIAVTDDYMHYTTCNAHSTDQYQRTIQWFYDITELYPPTFDRCTFYHMPRTFSGSGSGTESDPYIITNIYQLQEMNNDLDAWYELGNDIDASVTENENEGAGFIPVGGNDDGFCGHFDGHGHTIKNLYINRPEMNFVGLFGYVGWYGSVRNVEIEDCSIKGNFAVGGLVGELWYSTVSNACVTGMVTGDNSVRGLDWDGLGLLHFTQSRNQYCYG